MSYLLNDIWHKSPERKRLASDIEEFQRKGGTIDPCNGGLPPGESDLLVEAPTPADAGDIEAVARRVDGEDARPEA